MIAVTRGIANFDGRSRFTTWLYRVATNAALDEARRRQRRPLIVEDLPETRASEDVASDVANKIVIEEAMAMIAPEFRACIALRDLMGFDYAQIAEILEIPPGTVRSRIARGRGALAGLLLATNSDEIGNQTTASQRPTVEP